MNKKKVISLVICLCVVCAFIGWCVYEIQTETQASEISVADAESLLNEQFDKIAVTKATKLIAKENQITVNKVSYGDEKNAAYLEKYRPRVKML